MYKNGLFNSALSSSNPFSLNGNNNTGNNLDNTLMEAYAKLDALKQQQNQLSNIQSGQVQVQQKSTVFTEIADEFKNLSEDEMGFITNSKEYIDSFNKYQTVFSEFLTAKFSNEFLQSGNGRCVEELLFTIRQKKEAYKGKFAKDISEIQEQNKTLASTNNALLESNAKLQMQLEEIQRKLASR